MDWYYKFSFIPNHKAMKISSYHKQRGDVVNFVLEKAHLSFEHDIIYVIKENKMTPFPPMAILDSQKSKLIGREFIYHDGIYEPDAVIGMVRPDYGLYPVPERNAYANAHVAQFFHKTTLLPAQQNFMNEAAKHHRKTLVVDEFMWHSKKENIKNVLLRLKGLKNIAFLKPISLKMVVLDKEIRELFLALNFTRGTLFKFRNDIGSEFEEVKEIIDFMVEFREMKHVKTQGFPVKAVLYEHWDDKDLGIMDLERCLKIVDYGKANGVKVLLKTPAERLATPYWRFFDIMQVWTDHGDRLSYVEAMLQSTMRRNGLTWYDTLNNVSKWSTPRVFFLLHVLTTYPSLIKEFGTRKWKEEKIDLNKLKIETIVKSRNYFEQEDILHKIQHELLTGDD